MSESHSTKQCFKCGDVKPLEEFYVHRQMADGHLNKCKTCTKKDIKLDREQNRKKHSIREKKRNNTPERKKQQAENQRRMRLKYPEKYKAYWMVNSAIRSGKLKKEPCIHCGSKNSEAHHDDYDKPLDVKWVCFKCHAEKFHGKVCVVGDVIRKKGKNPYNPVAEKECTLCGLVKKRSDFPLKTNSVTGLYSWCKECVSVKHKEYRSK